jgi:hypothetical protein
LSKGYSDDIVVKCPSWKKCRRKYRRKDINAAAPSKWMVYKLVAKLLATGAVLDKKTPEKGPFLPKKN